MVLILKTAESEIWECVSCDGDGVRRPTHGGGIPITGTICRHCGGKGRVVISQPPSLIRTVERGMALGAVYGADGVHP
jgi:hypothetical protein